MIRFLCVWLIALSLAHASTNDGKRYTKLTHEIRCVSCQNQSIADSEAPLAKDLCKKIAGLIEQKMTDQAIKDYLVKRYGEVILLDPRFSLSTLPLWVFPFLCLSVIAWLFRHKNMIR